MRNVMRAECYKLRHDVLIWFIPILYAVMGWYGSSYYHQMMDYRRGLELFALPDIAWIPLAFAVVIVSGYTIGQDFSRHTIQNALAVGVNKKNYYFSRLLVQMAFTGGMFVLALLVHTVCRLIRPKGNSDTAIRFLGAKLLVYMFVVLLLLWVYVSVVNMLTYFIKKQVIVMAVGMGLVYGEVIIRQAAISNGWKIIESLVSWMPTGIERGLFKYAVYDTIFTADFLLSGICAAAIIAVSSLIGYVKFCYGTDIN